MMTDPANALGPPHPRLLVERPTGATPPAVDAVIWPAGCGGAGPSPLAGIIWRWSPGRTLPAEATICAADGGLDAAAGLAAERRGLTVAPRAEVRQGASRYSFVPALPGEGFSTYRLDPGSVAEFLVTEDGRDTRLADWLKRAARLGFQTVWLHGVEADAARRGFPIDMLRRAHRLAPGVTFWLSGGGCVLRHFARLTAEAGLTTVVVPEANLAALGPEAVLAAMDQAPIESAAS